jgi:hypothetical protein
MRAPLHAPATPVVDPFLLSRDSREFEARCHLLGVFPGMLPVADPLHAESVSLSTIVVTATART